MECESPLPGPSSAVSPTSCAASVASLGSTGSANDLAAKKAEMVATLQARRAQLEAKLAAKNEELKMLCIQEAELTGVLPPEIPLEPGETPPTLRRRVGTSFTLPESLLNKLRSTEEESVPAVELEIKIQTGIAEAALGLANDTAANKHVRRKHRLMYQQSQRRLQDLETKLIGLREKQEALDAQNEALSCAQPQQPTQQQHMQYHQQLQQQQQNQLKHRKKPRPPVDNDSDVAEVDGSMLHAGGISLSPLGQMDRDIREGRLSSALTASTNTVGLPLQPATTHRHSSYRYSTIDSSWNMEPDRLSRRETVQTGAGSSNYWNASASRQEIPSPGSSRYSSSRYPSGIPVEMDESLRPANQRWKRDRSMMGMSRFGSLDRRRAGAANVTANTTSSTVSNIDEAEAGVPALLPSQTYPEHSLGHSLVRTQSLGSVEATRPRNLQSDRDASRDGSQTIDRKPKEKEWYETSLDVAPVLSPQGSQGEPQSQHSHPPLQASLSHPPPHPHMYQSHPQLHHAPHQSPPLPLPLSQSHSHSHLAQVATPVSVHIPNHHSQHSHSQHHPSFASSIPQSQSHPQLHMQGSMPHNPPQLPPHPQLHPKLSSTQSVSHLTVHIPPPKPHLPPPHSHQYSQSQPPAIPPHAAPPSAAPPLPPHPSSHSPAHAQSHPPPLPPSHSSMHHSPQLPPQIPPHTPVPGHMTSHPSHASLHSIHTAQQITPRNIPPEVPPHVPSHAQSHHASHAHPPPPPPPQSSASSHPPLSPKSDDGPLSPPHVPLESPKNHMVVQAGSWQPYREVTKPFEMSDFYKYSTKFRKQMHPPPPPPPPPTSSSVTLSPDGAPQSPQSPQQQKGVYTPLQPLTCQPLEPQCSMRPPGADSSFGSPAANSESLADAFSNEMLAWFQDQRAPPAPTPATPASGPPQRSATLV